MNDYETLKQQRMLQKQNFMETAEALEDQKKRVEELEEKNRILIAEKMQIIRQLEEREQSLEEYKKISNISDKSAPRKITGNGKGVSSDVKMWQMQYRSVKRMLCCNMIVFLLGLLWMVISSKHIRACIMGEAKAWCEVICQTKTSFYTEYFTKYVNEGIFDALVSVFFIITVLGMCTLIKYRTTMWRFYYIDRGIQTRSIDWLRLLCGAEIVLCLLIIFVEAIGGKYIVLPWIVAVGVLSGIVYLKKITIAYYRRITAVKEKTV